MFPTVNSQYNNTNIIAAMNIHNSDEKQTRTSLNIEILFNIIIIHSWVLITNNWGAKNLNVLHTEGWLLLLLFRMEILLYHTSIPRHLPTLIHIKVLNRNSIKLFSLHYTDSFVPIKKLKCFNMIKLCQHYIYPVTLHD